MDADIYNPHKTTDYIVEVNALRKAFNGRISVKDVSFKIPHGTCFGLIGPSGAGKSTLMKCLLGIYEPDKGAIFFNGVSGISRDALGKIGYSPQDNSVYPELTAVENLRYFGKLYGVKESELTKRIPQILQLVNLLEKSHEKARNLSGGQLKRLDFACSLIHDPDFLILDEPTTGLDPKQEMDIWHVIQTIKESGTAILLTTHSLKGVNLLCDQVAFIHEGDFIFKGTLAEFKQHFSYQFEIVLETEKQEYREILENISSLIWTHFIHDGKLYAYANYSRIDEGLQYILEDIKTVIDKRKDRIVSLEIKEPSLDDVFSAILEGVKSGKTKVRN